MPPVSDDGEADADPRSRYPAYDVLARRSTPDWDAQTREVVRRRLDEVPPIRFFTPDEARLLEAIVARIVPQPVHAEGARIPIVPWIDEKLHHDWRSGYRYEELPEQRTAWRRGIAAVDETARRLRGRGFLELSAAEQDDLLRGVQEGDVPADAWLGLPPRRFFRDVLCLTVVKTYYAHPAAWSEIGYGGPAAVRGHVRTWTGGVDPWEPEESPTSPSAQP